MARDLNKAKVQDPEGVDWHRNASERWNRYMERAGGDGEAANAAWALEPEPLPDWKAKAPAIVTREVLGRFLENRDTGVVHDVYNATPGCLLDEVRNATFWHFWSEVKEGIPEGEPCGNCIP